MLLSSLRIRIISAREATPAERRFYEEGTEAECEDELRAEYEFAQLQGGVTGKYAERYRAGTNLVLLAPDVAKAFPDDDSG